MRIGIHQSVFERFPGYRRGLVIARGTSIRSEDAVLAERLRAAEHALAEVIPSGDWRSHPRVAAWLEAFQALGIPTGARPPSIAALVKRTAKGGSLPFINQMVALMNITSLERLIPCGGDDLGAVGVDTDLMLRPATGSESYRPLGRPDILEHPDPGEMIYVSSSPTGSRSADEEIVLCRSWCWRNSDVTKLTQETTAACLNLDFLAPAVPVEIDEVATTSLADDVRRHCGGEVICGLLTPEQPTFDLGSWT